MKRWPRVMMMVAVWALIGAGITVVVAWGAVWKWEACNKQSAVYFFSGTGANPARDRTESVQRAWPIAVPRGWPPPEMQWTDRSACCVDVDVVALSPIRFPLRSARVTSFGWPCSALQCGYWTEMRQPYTTVSHYEWALQSTMLSEYVAVPQLPLRPLWPGFAINTLLYAALAWGLWPVPLFLRRRHRRARNRCTRCGYSLAGLGAGAACPECGKGDTAPSVPPSPRTR